MVYSSCIRLKYYDECTCYTLSDENDLLLSNKMKENKLFLVTTFKWQWYLCHCYTTFLLQAFKNVYLCRLSETLYFIISQIRYTSMPFCVQTFDLSVSYTFPYNVYLLIFSLSFKSSSNSTLFNNADP